MGHASIRAGVEADEYYCTACGRSHDHGPYDAAEWAFPVLPPKQRTWLAGTKAEAALREGLKNE